LQEWINSAKILGADEITALHYPDGALEKIPEDNLDTAVGRIIAEKLAFFNYA
jgi:LmbE family N-acetylglucosaminyl deacetylase